jgi:general secretion pathway protein I
MAGRTWYWQQKVVKTANEEMRQVTMEIRLVEDDELVSASLITYVSRDTP